MSREWLHDFIQNLETVGLWAMEEGLPDPEKIWAELNNPLCAISVGLLKRIKDCIKEHYGALDYIIREGRENPSREVAIDLYYLFVFYEYPEAKRAALTFTKPEHLEIFEALVEVVKQLRDAM